MPVTIIQRTISAAVETAASVNNGQIGRSVSLPASWSKIRVGIRHHLTDFGSDLVSAGFYLGFGSGTSSLIGDYSTTHFVGIRAFYTPCTRSANSYTWGTGTVVLLKKVGTTLTTSAAINTVIMFLAKNATLANRSLLYVDLIKGSPNYTIRAWIHDNTDIETDYSAAYFLTDMSNDPPTAAARYYYTAATTLAVNEAVDGTLNAVHCYWNQIGSQIEICDIAVKVLA